MRVVCVHVPHFHVQVECLKDPDLGKRPVVIVGMPEERGFVIDCSEELAQRGVAPTMPLKDVYHLCYDAVPVLVRRREHSLLWEEVLSSIAGITLRMEPKEEGTVFLDVTRLPGMYKSEEQVASALGCMISDRFQLNVRIGAGNSRFMAFEAALCALKDARVIPSGMEKDFLSPLNIDRLPVPDDVRERLRLLGLHSLGQISAFTLSALTSQFGAVGKDLWELSNGIGERGRIPCAFTITDVDRELVCDGPVHSKQEIKAALLELLDGLCLELEELGKACRTVRLVLDLRNRTFFEKQFVLHAPTARKEDMLRRIMAGLEGVELAGPVRIMSVRAGGLVNHDGRQERLFRSRPGLTQGMKDVSGFLKTKYGALSLARAVRNDSGTHLPDDRFIFVEP